MKAGIGLLISLALVLAAVSIGAAPPKEASADKAAPADKQDEKKETNRVRYARTYMEMAKLELKIAQDRNRQVPQTLPPAIMLVLEEHVTLAKLWMEQEMDEAAGKSSTDLAVKMADIRLTATEMAYAQLQEADRISRQPPDRLERLRLKVELARLNVAGAKELDASNPEQLLEFEFERLREEVSELYIRQLKVLDRN